MKTNYIKAAGILNLGTALLHLIGGQIDLVNPLLSSDLSIQQKGELTGAWHIVTILLFLTSYRLLQIGFRPSENHQNIYELKSIGILYLLSGIPFVIVSIYYKIFVPQWVLLIPIGILILLGISKKE